MARNKTWVSTMLRLACPNATQPASNNSAISTSRSPASCTVSAPTGCTWAKPGKRARCVSICTKPGSSSGGSVSGGHDKRVTPPATAAAISDCKVALYSKPGSRRRAQRSTSPGQTTQPLASSTLVGLKLANGVSPAPTINPSATKISASRSIPLAGSISRPPLICSFSALLIGHLGLASP